MRSSKTEEQLKQFRSLFLSGKMTKSDIIQRLQMMIDKELSKPSEEVDTDYIDACTSFTLQLEKDSVEPREWYFREQKERLMKELRKRETIQNRVRILKPIIAISVALIVVFLGFGAFHFQWFTMQSTTDQQQLIIQGHEISVDMVKKAIAEHQDEEMYSTNELNKLEQFLGFPLKHLDLTNSGWIFNNSWTYISDDSVDTTIQYIRSGAPDTEVMYNITWFTDIENAQISVEQNETGDFKKLFGKDIYCIQNYDRNIYIWMDNATVYRISSLLSGNTLEQFLVILLE